MKATNPEERALPKQISDRIDHLRSLKHDWDSYGADPISPKAIDAAEHLICRSIALLEERGKREPTPYVIAPVADGGVQVEWRGAAGALEVEVAPENDAHALIIGTNSKTICRRLAEATSVLDLPLH